MIPEGFDRVTDVLSSLNDYSHIDPAVLANAAERGRRVHGLCERYALREQNIRADSDTQNYFTSYMQWFDENVKSVEFLETRVNSFSRMLSGQIDMICILKDSDYLTLVDIKTPAQPSPTWGLQTAAYRILTREEMDVKVYRRICLMLPKQGGKAKVKEYFNHNEDEAEFFRILSEFRERKFAERNSLQN